jgi:5'-deoxynucleotidase YfbR-like HD superfamily hydrolase
MLQTQIDFLYRAGSVKRFHTVATLRQQDLGNHHWHVALLGHFLYGQDEPGVSAPFLMALLTHDMPEEEYGDMPAPAKRKLCDTFDDFREKWGEMEQAYAALYSMDWEKFLTEEEKRRVKFCDALEGMFYCIGERALGNQTIAVCYSNFENYVGELLEDCGDVPFDATDITPDQIICNREWEAFNHAQRLWRVADGQR